MNNKELLEIAEKARENSYSPYSNFKVGAALLTKSGKVFTGCNVECASFSGTNCAERTAIFKAISEGYKDIEAIAIASTNSEKNESTYPCAICRQVIIEFGPDIRIITGYSKGDMQEHTIAELVPHYFSGSEFK
ncbi:cytidine deaminase [Paraclostridium sordellii]|uniref:cytidine deaminase n=1 Tax=Paraclostridium sordellii TaxID=1505 RepID=UPI000386CD45|nr:MULTISPECIES: cytidine deaminase [Paeniclostridium]EPZ58298.1 cytidine deaminase [[Clostridium] sordellii VPI 9048] [Paeniclostridium sordellii VPI 9048]MBW4861856.1 cytidine deaminase [Paeniclostridium sp.]MBW4874096.1 cytidine deaminase [Paeniclostridium sp.]CEK37143.1 Cytidine deaminase (Cytidine aminohydrolase)(CDA) [[Clostridium] sordellii] [Paeniclostridium sordellii]CEN92494.1 cytidine deaminase (Cytidine aminohydrolase) (CDA) [[Clostridium] sordellii] [Paeniclostridium sordellii]